MPDKSDTELLSEYCQGQSEEAFAQLVQRHVALVYSAALRHAANAGQAEEISQAVFILLAHKAARLRPGVILEGWFYETTRLTALAFLRGERRRQFREQEAYMQSTLDDATDNLVWTQLAPLLDEAMARLDKKDRDAVVLRFFKEQSVRDVAVAIQVSEAAAQRRILRALEKLRKFFVKRGVCSTTAIIAGAISANSIHAAPAGLGNLIAAAAVAKGAAASTSTLSLVKGALKIMAWTKAKTAIVTGTCILLAAGAGTVTVKKMVEPPSWRHEGFNSAVLDRQRPQVAILPSQLRGESHGFGSHGNTMGTGVSAQTVVSVAYGLAAPARTVLAAELPTNRYDYIASLPAGNAEALQNEVKKTFGVTAKYETRPAEVLLLKAKAPYAAGLKPDFGPLKDSWESWGYNYYRGHNKPLGHLACALELAAGIPVIDTTGLTNNFSLQFQWNQRDLQTPDVSAMNQALNAQLGLELVPTNMPIAMLVVEKAK